MLAIRCEHRGVSSKFIFMLAVLSAIILPICHDESNPSLQGPELQAYARDELWGYRSRTGKTVIEPRYHIANGFSEQGLAQVVDDKGWAVIDTGGKVLFRPFVYDNGPDLFQEGLARFVLRDKIGFYKPDGAIAIPARFDFAEPFRDGTARVCEGCRPASDGEHTRMVDGVWWNVDKTGKKVE